MLLTNAQVTINDLASWPFAIGAAAVLLTVFAYGWPPTPWYKSLLGVAFMGDLLAHLIVVGIVFGRRFFGDYPGYELVAWGGYTVYAVAGIVLLVVVIYTRRTGKDIDFTPPAPTRRDRPRNTKES